VDKFGPVPLRLVEDPSFEGLGVQALTSHW